MSVPYDDVVRMVERGHIDRFFPPTLEVILGHGHDDAERLFDDEEGDEGHTGESDEGEMDDEVETPDDDVSRDQ